MFCLPFDKGVIMTYTIAILIAEREKRESQDNVDKGGDK